LAQNLKEVTSAVAHEKEELSQPWAMTSPLAPAARSTPLGTNQQQPPQQQKQQGLSQNQQQHQQQQQEWSRQHTVEVEGDWEVVSRQSGRSDLAVATAIASSRGAGGEGVDPSSNGSSWSGIRGVRQQVRDLVLCLWREGCLGLV
jgi:hypothetical protein